MRRPLALLAATSLVAALAGGTSLAASSTSAPSSVKTGSSSLGRILVDGKSRTLYLFGADKNGRSSCTGACATFWPPLLAKGSPKAGGAAKQALLGTVRRSDGKLQVTYNRHPLYTFSGDAGKRGSTKGEGMQAFGATWYVLAAKGTSKTGGY